MEVKYTREDLIQFEDDIVQMYREGKIKAPLHLSGGNEFEIIEIFKEVHQDDFIFTTYRSHYHALLKGMPRQRLIDWIVDCKSIHVMDSENKIFSSAIVAATISIALGYALSVRMRNSNEHVWCFIGDMTASTGTFKDCLQYAMNFNLPITFVIENNGLSTDTKTHAAWGTTEASIENTYNSLAISYPKFVKHYKYIRTRPHYGIGEFVIFPEDKVDSGRSF